MTGLFEDISLFDEGKRLAARQAAAVAQKRVSDRVSGYLEVAKNAEEYGARLGYVEDDVRQIVADVAEEYNADVDALQEAIDEHLKGDGITDLNDELEGAPSAVGHKAAGGHKPGCECGFCKNKGNLPGSKKDDDSDADDEPKADDDAEASDDGDDKPDFLEDKESSTHIADAPRDGGGATKTVDLPHAKGDAVGYGASPKIDKKEWKPNALNDSGNLKPVDAEMSGTPVPTQEQDLVDETPDYEGDFLRDTDAVTKSQDLPTADESGASTERNISQDNQGGSWTEAQNDPVTASVDPDINPLKAILDNGFVTDNTVESAIRDFEAEKE